MAIERPVTPDDRLFTGEDKQLIFTIYERDEQTPQDVNGWDLSWMLKRKKLDPDSAAFITKTIGNDLAITGTFDPDPSLNSQRVVVDLFDTETELLSSTVTYYHELKRKNIGQETILTWGSFVVRQAIHRV